MTGDTLTMKSNAQREAWVLLRRKQGARADILLEELLQEGLGVEEAEALLSKAQTELGRRAGVLAVTGIICLVAGGVLTFAGEAAAEGMDGGSYVIFIGAMLAGIILLIMGGVQGLRSS